MVNDGVTQCRITLDQIAGNVDGFVCRIVQQLNVEFFARISQLADRIQQPFDDVLLVENWQLHGDPWQIVESGRRLNRAPVFVLVIKIDQYVTMNAVAGQQNQHNEIRDEQRSIEGISVVETLERSIEQVMAQIGTDAARGPERELRNRRVESRRQQEVRRKPLFYRIRQYDCLPSTLPREHRNDLQVLVLKTLVEQTFYSRCYAPAGESANCSAFSKRITSSRAKLRRDWACNRH